MITRRLPVGGGGSFVVPLPTGVLTYGTPFDIVNDAKANALPTACGLGGGTLLLVWAKSDDFETTKANIVGLLITEAGVPIGSEFTIASHATLSAFNPGVCTTNTGRVVVMYNLFNHSSASTAADSVRITYSDNAALGASATWSSPYTVDASFTGYCASGTSRPVVLPDNTIIIPVYGDSGGNSSSEVFFSTDDGATFGGAVTMANGPSDGRNYYEPSIARLVNGTLRAQYRTTSPAGDMYQNQSTDDGATWGATSVAFGAFSPSNIIQRPNQTIVAVVRWNPDGDPHAVTSIDSGASWSDQGAIEAAFAMLYGLWMERSDGSGLIIFANQPAASEANIDIRGVAVTEAAA